MRRRHLPAVIAVIAVIALVGCGAPRREGVDRRESTKPPELVDAAVDAAPSAVPTFPFTLLVQPRLSVFCANDASAPFMVACRQDGKTQVEHACPPLPRWARPRAVAAQHPDDGDFAVFPRDLDLSGNHRHAVDDQTAPSEAELRAMVQAMLAAGVAIPSGKGADSRPEVGVPGQVTRKTEPRPARPVVTALENPTVQAGFTLELSGDGRDDRIYLINALGVDSQGGKGGVKALVYVDAAAPSAPILVIDAGTSDVRLLGAFVFEGAEPLIWVQLEQPAVGCNTGYVLRLTDGRFITNTSFTLCCIFR